jgi:hypothetical protein
MWNGDNYPQEYEPDTVDPADFEPVDPSELGWGETDGAVSINAMTVAKRLNDLLVIVQQQHDEIVALRRRPGCACLGDA